MLKLVQNVSATNVLAFKIIYLKIDDSYEHSKPIVDLKSDDLTKHNKNIYKRVF